MELETVPGETTGMHSHGDHIVYFVTEGMALQTNADGSTQDRQIKAGEIMWSGPVTHETRNAGTARVKTLIIELKEPGTVVESD